jgi:hypothetical protein
MVCFLFFGGALEWVLLPLTKKQGIAFRSSSADGTGHMSSLTEYLPCKRYGTDEEQLLRHMHMRSTLARQS